MDDIISQYLKPKEGEQSTEVAKPRQVDDIVKMYLKDNKSSKSERLSERLYVSPAPPISGASKEESDRIISERSKEYNKPSLQEGMEQYPIRAGKAAYDEAKEGILEAGKGLGDTLSGKPASGLADVGIGALRTIGSPIEGVKQFVGDLTGSKNVADRAGLVAGSALPIDMGVSKAKAMLPSNKAFKTLVESIGPENVGNIAREMRANERLSPIDLSPKVLQDTQHLFVTDGPHINYLANAVENRLSGAKQSSEDAFTGAMGQTVNPVEKLKQLSDNIKAVGAKEINPVLKQTKPVDLTPVVEHIDNILKPGVMHVISNPESMLPYDKVQKLLESWRGQLTNDKTVLTNPDVLNKIQSGMRRQAESLMRTPDAESKAMGYALYKVRNEIIEAIGKAGPQTVDKNGKAISSYRAGLSKYKDENDVATAFEHGHDTIIKNSKNLEDHPEFFKNWVKGATKEELDAAREGAKVAIDTQINGYRAAATNPASKGIQIAQVDFNRQRIETLFGKEEADKLFKKLDDERKIANSNNKIVEGSQTAMRNASKEKFTPPEKSKMENVAPYVAEGLGALTTGMPGVGVAGYNTLKLLNTGRHAIATKMFNEHNSNYAKLALPIEGSDREALIKSLEAVANKQKPSILSRANSVARLFGP